MMSEQEVPRSVEQRIVIKYLVGENVPSAEIHHRLQQQYGEECLLRSPGTVRLVAQRHRRVGVKNELVNPSHIPVCEDGTYIVFRNVGM